MSINNKKKPLDRHKIVLENTGKGMPLGKAMRLAGYADSYADNPQDFKETKSWEALMEEHLSDARLTQVHEELLSARRLEHMVFPPEAQQKKKGTEVLSDDMIKEFMASVNCVVRKIVHQDMARHVYFWAYDNQARDKALDKGYKLKSKYAPEEFNLKFKGFSKAQIIDNIMNKITKKK